MRAGQQIPDKLLATVPKTNTFSLANVPTEAAGHLITVPRQGFPPHNRPAVSLITVRSLPSQPSRRDNQIPRKRPYQQENFPHKRPCFRSAASPSSSQPSRVTRSSLLHENSYRFPRKRPCCPRRIPSQASLAFQRTSRHSRLGLNLHLHRAVLKGDAQLAVAAGVHERVVPSEVRASRRNCVGRRVRRDGTGGIRNLRDAVSIPTLLVPPLRSGRRIRGSAGRAVRRNHASR